MVKISLDAMGGDLGAPIVIEGAAIALKKHNNIEYIIHGIEDIVIPLLAKYPELKNCSSFIPCETVTSMDEKPSSAIRSGKGRSSMWRAIESVKNESADACVSAGNTGALMAMSYLILGMLAEANRPAIAGIWPNLNGEGIVLDIGATIGADANHLVDLAIMGACMYRALYNIDKPSIGLLNIGSEEIKGLDEIKEANKILKDLDLDNLVYKGFIEGNDIGKGIVDVVVTEGFTGNIALKTAEGTARQMAQLLREALSQNIFTKLGYFFAKSGFKTLRRKMDPARVNGGVLLGLRGVIVKSHGHTSPLGYASAIRVAYEMVHNGLQKRIEKDLHSFHSSRATNSDN